MAALPHKTPSRPNWDVAIKIADIYSAAVVVVAEAGVQRSIGVTLSAVLVFFGCAMALLCAALIAFASQVSPSQVLSTPLVRTVLIVEIVVDLAFVGWGIASGIGLLQLKQWARISMIIFSGIMICFCAIPMAIFLFVPLPQAQGMPLNFGMMVRVFVELFYGFFVVLGAVWIYFFNRRNVKAQFAPTSVTDASMTAVPASPVAELQRRKVAPVPIIIVAALFLLSACFMPFALKMHTPMFLFGSFVKGSAGAVFILAVIVFDLAAGIGLLRVKLWGWRLALLLSIFNVLNTAFLVFTPAAIDRMNETMAAQYVAMGMPDVAAQYPFEAILRFGFGFGLAVTAALLVVLIVCRKAFSGNDTGGDIKRLS